MRTGAFRHPLRPRPAAGRACEAKAASGGPVGAFWRDRGRRTLFLREAAGAPSGWATPWAVLVGTPIYLDGYAALPLVRGLIDLGMTPGAAMAFLVAGGITSPYASIAGYGYQAFLGL